MKKLICLVCLILAITFLAQSNRVLAQAPAPESLYNRLGGIHSVSAVVDDFIDRLLADPAITKNKDVVSALANITKPGLKYLLTEMICETSGGPQKYTGRTMKESHEHLNITEDEWQAMVKDFLSTLIKFKVPEKEQSELLLVVGSTKADIVTAKKPIAQVAPPLPEPQPEPKTKAALKERDSVDAPPPPNIPGLPILPGQ